MTADQLRSRAITLAAVLEPLPLRRELEVVLEPNEPHAAAHAVDDLLDAGLLEAVQRSGSRVRLTDAGRRTFALLPGDPRPRTIRVA